MAGRQINEFAEEIPSRIYGKASKKIDAIVSALKSGNQKLLAYEKLIQSANCVLVKPYLFILDNSGRVVTLSQIINYYGINTTGSVRCPVCKESFTYDTILFHLEQKYESGHSLKLKDITKLFERRWYNWDYTDNNFYDGKEAIEEFWKK